MIHILYLKKLSFTVSGKYQRSQKWQFLSKIYLLQTFLLNIFTIKIQTNILTKFHQQKCFI